MTQAKTTLKYYDFKHVLSRNAVYNFVIGARGLGKTYGAKMWCVKDFIKNGNQFIYLRRYQTELSTRATFFADIKEQFPDYAFRVNGENAEINMNTGHSKKDDDWQVCGYFIALSRAQSKKSVAYPRVTKIIYDEFIVDKGHIIYLPQEAKAFNDFFSTVDRYKDKTRVLFLANAVSIMNPYFIEFNIRPQRDMEWLQSHNGFICAHFAPSKEFATGVYRTRFGAFIQDSEYADYSVGSQFFDNSDAMIKPKTSEAAYMYTLETKTGISSVWVDFTDNTYYVQEKRPKQERYWTMMHERMSEGKTLVLYSDRSMQLMRAAFGKGKVFFDSPQSRNAFIGVFNR